MRYKEIKIVLGNGVILKQEDIAKIEGFIIRTNEKIKFEIDLNNKKDVYKLYKDFKKEVAKSVREIQKAMK